MLCGFTCLYNNDVYIPETCSEIDYQTTDYIAHEVTNQTKDNILAAVKQNGLALEFVDCQTEEICLTAVAQNGLALHP